MTPHATGQMEGPWPTCPLCQTVDRTVTCERLATGATWQCTRCGQTWSGERLERVAAYLKFGAHLPPLAPATT